MSLFNFTDKKSERQIAIAGCRRNDTQRQNDLARQEFYRKLGNLGDARRCWEVDDEVEVRVIT